MDHPHPATDRRHGTRRRREVIGRLRRRGGAQDGVVLVLTAMLLVALLGMTALALDTGVFRGAQTRAQAAADAAALAAAADLPNNPTQAATDATSYVTANDPGATVTVTTPYDGYATEAEVVVNGTAKSSFGTVFGLSQANVSATAVSQETEQTTCGTPGNTCYSIFAMDSSSCGSWLFPHYDISLSGAGLNITGAIDSNGSVNASLATFSSFGPGTYSDASGCQWNQGFLTFDSYSSSPASADPTTTWPADYSEDFPACGATSDPCTGPGGTPGFCTQESTSSYWITSPSNGNIYCGVGSGTASNPSTWNATLIVGSGLVGSSGHPVQASYVAGNVSLGAVGDYLEACGYSVTGFNSSGCSAPTPALSNYPLIYAVSGNIGTGSLASTLTGDLFAPNGSITYVGALSSVGFLEANDVTYAGILTGDGPTTSGTVPASSSLVG
ncbi:MAG: pilus assembly protein TadG-related protein [Solirubrobacteraceae bacterium]|jgi:Flp pilus assembly protein TadG